MSKFSHARKVAFSVLDKTVWRGVLQYIDHEQSFLMEADKYASFLSARPVIFCDTYTAYLAADTWPLNTFILSPGARALIIP